MADPSLLSPDEARQLLEYDPDTGIFRWKPRPRSMFRCDKEWRQFGERHAGREAGSISWAGYWNITLKIAKVGKRVIFKGHHLAWAITHGEWPHRDGMVMDHINGIRSDNRIINLRVVTRAINNRNTVGRPNKTSGHPCVFKRTFGWEVRVRLGEKVAYLGTFKTRAEAIKVVHSAWDQKGGYSDRHKYTVR